jgi:hypothetical protein
MRTTKSKKIKLKPVTRVGSGTLVMPHCPDCERGYEPRLIDEDGMLSEMSGETGRWSHAYDMYWWDCPRKQSASKVRHKADLSHRAANRHKSQ